MRFYSSPHLPVPPHHPPAPEPGCSTSAADLSVRIAPEDRDSGIGKLEQPLTGKEAKTATDSMAPCA
jgi:hypothetical protein